jgi:hypothetical protein
MSWATRQELTPAQQFQFLARNPICAGSGTIGARGLSWTFDVQPTPLHRQYRARIEFDKGRTPKVMINDPVLEELARGRPLPHIYRDPTRLCLYLPGTEEWHGSMRIDLTFVPWTSTWLFYFEEWLASGEWKGGGQHPEPDHSEQYPRRARRGALASMSRGGW